MAITLFIFGTALTVSGGHGEEETPVPIPNTEVKLFCADGTAWETVWESRTLPKNFYITRNHHLMAPGFFYGLKPLGGIRGRIFI